jgi:hypothetical protein
MKTKARSISISVTRAEKKAIDDLARELGLSRSSLIKLLINNAITRRKGTDMTDWTRLRIELLEITIEMCEDLLHDQDTPEIRQILAESIAALKRIARE